VHADTGSQVRRLLAPRHIAFVGGRSLEAAIGNCRALGYAGEMWVVNPAYDELAGLPCYPSVAELPAAPDAAFPRSGAPSNALAFFVRPPLSH
jgi:acetate---CoA ligase (ADP-forming)